MSTENDRMREKGLISEASSLNKEDVANPQKAFRDRKKWQSVYTHWEGFLPQSKT